MTQLVELQQALPKFQAAGIRLYAVSYDTVAELAAFSAAHDIEFTLLADKGSRVIREYGILNHFVTRDQVPYYGIPFPGTYLVDERGDVTAKLFQRNLAQRDNAETMIDRTLGEILLGGDEPTTSTEDDDIRLSVTYHGGGGAVKAGVLRHLVVRFDLADGLHIYDEPVPQGMVATRIRVEGPPGIHTEEVRTRPTSALQLPGLDMELQVWSGRVDFSIPIWADDRVQSLITDTGLEQVELKIHVDFQACDDSVCRIPQTRSLELTVPVEPYIGHNLAGRLVATMTGMDSERYMRRKVLRALLYTPIGGLRYIRSSLAALRRGPTSRRRSHPPR